jgi:hypothetical protein
MSSLDIFFKSPSGSCIVRGGFVIPPAFDELSCRNGAQVNTRNGTRKT